MWSERLAEKINRAAALRTDWSLSSRRPETPTSTVAVVNLADDKVEAVHAARYGSVGVRQNTI